MAITLPSPLASQEYTDMELGSFFLHVPPSQPQREFEFQMSVASSQREVTMLPADQLFYMGKLLPLQLRPRIQLVEKLLRDSVSAYEEFYGTPLISTAVSSPFESRNVFPYESCSFCRELNPDVHFREFLVKPMGNNPENSWSENIKLIKRRLFGPRLKGSRAIFKSLLGKSGCSDDSSAAATKSFVPASSRKRRESQNSKGNQQKGDGSRRATKGDDFSSRQHGRPSSSSSKWLTSSKIGSSSFSSTSSSSSSSCSLSTSASMDRDRGDESESQNSSRLPYMNAESPIQAAIAYCKQSQEPKEQ